MTNQAYEEGFAVGQRNGQLFECPYLEFTLEAIQWMLGYSAGSIKA